MLPGFEIFYQTIVDSLKTKNESVVAIIHYILVYNGYKIIGLNDQFEEDSKNSKGSESLPEKWNEKESFIFRYIHKDSKNLLLVKIIPSGDVLLVNALLKETDKCTAVCVDPKLFLKDDFKNTSNIFLAENSGDNLLKLLNKDLIEGLALKEKKKEPDVKIKETSSQSLLIERPYYPRGDPNTNINTPNIFPMVGRADLDPLGRGIGGGMLVDPASLEGLNRPFGNQPRNPFSRFDPSSGLDVNLPEGSVPPGARFDFIGPPKRNRNQDRPNRNHPDLEHFKSDYDDMFM